jgi:hypothetical protein
VEATQKARLRSSPEAKKAGAVLPGLGPGIPFGPSAADARAGRAARRVPTHLNPHRSPLRGIARDLRSTMAERRGGAHAYQVSPDGLEAELRCLGSPGPAERFAMPGARDGQASREQVTADGAVSAVARAAVASRGAWGRAASRVPARALRRATERVSPVLAMAPAGSPRGWCPYGSSLRRLRPRRSCGIRARGPGAGRNRQTRTRSRPAG